MENLASVGSAGSALLSKEEEGEVAIVHVELLGKPYNISVRCRLSTRSIPYLARCLVRTHPHSILTPTQQIPHSTIP